MERDWLPLAEGIGSFAFAFGSAILAPPFFGGLAAWRKLFRKTGIFK